MKKILSVILLLVLCMIFVGCSHEHTMEEQTMVELTCNSSGSIKHYCIECDYNYTEELEATGHNYDEGKVIIEPTCTNAGSKEFVCTVCGEKKEEIIAAKHTFEEEILIEASCNKAGSKNLICSICGHQETQEIKATGHFFIENTCTKCDAYKATEITPNYWYTYTELNILKIQNAIVLNATTSGNGIMVSYSAICSKCHIVGSSGLAGPEVNYPVSKTHYCEECGEKTLVKFKIEY